MVPQSGKLSQNLQDIHQSHKVYRGNHENWKVELTAVGGSCGENPERYIPGRCAITITICNIDDATQSHN